MTLVLPPMGLQPQAFSPGSGEALKYQSVTCALRWTARAGHHTKEKGSTSTFSNTGIYNSLGKTFG